MRIINNLCRVISALLFVILLVLALLLAAPYIIGMKTYVVLNSSMEPDLPMGAIVYVKPCTPEDVAPDDIIAFTSPDNLMATHRVLEIREDSQSFLTQSNNPSIDSETNFDRLIGKVEGSVPMVGFLAAKLQGPLGIPIVAGVLILLVIVSFLPEVLKKNDPGQLPPGMMMQNGQMMPTMNPAMQGSQVASGSGPAMQGGQTMPGMDPAAGQSVQATPGMNPTMQGGVQMPAGNPGKGKKVKVCPRCSGDNKPGAKWCALCGFTFPKGLKPIVK